MAKKDKIKETLDAVSQEVVEVDTTVTAPVDANETIGDISVSDPEIARPRELPLIVKPANGGEWKNKEQAEYAKVVNAYAYKNPDKWKAVISYEGKFAGKSKKDVLIARLAEIGENPRMLQVYSPQERDAEGKAKLQYRNKLME